VQTYTVYERRVAPEDIEERATDLVFIKEGFSFWAFTVPALWFLLNGLWRGLLLYLVLSVVLMAGLAQLGASELLMGTAGLLLNLIFGFEARDIYRAALERQDYVLKGVVSGRNLEECERRFLLEWLPDSRRERDRMAAMAATGASGRGDASRSPSVPVIGMFPAHGG
jgi:Protein of unknown function (DUF2628)